MTTGSPEEDLRQLIASGSLTEETLAALVPMTREELDAARSGSFAALPSETRLLLSALVAQLCVGVTIDDDERLRGILETLRQSFQMTPTSIAALTSLHVDDLNTLARSPEHLSEGTKYTMGVRLYHLLMVCTQTYAQARGSSPSSAE